MEWRKVVLEVKSHWNCNATKDDLNFQQSSEASVEETWERHWRALAIS